MEAGGEGRQDGPARHTRRTVKAKALVGMPVT